MWQITFKTINSFFQNSTSKIKLNFKNQSNHQDTWKRSNTIPVHKKNEKQLVKIYRPISLSLIFGKTFEKIIFNKIYNSLLKEKLLNPNQSDFCPSDSCMNQPLGITHEIPQALTGNPPLEIRSLSLVYQKDLTKCGGMKDCLINTLSKCPGEMLLFKHHLYIIYLGKFLHGQIQLF